VARQSVRLPVETDRPLRPGPPERNRHARPTPPMMSCTQRPCSCCRYCRDPHDGKPHGWREAVGSAPP
jgi:hypothetical protein